MCGSGGRGSGERGGGLWQLKLQLTYKGKVSNTRLDSDLSKQLYLIGCYGN